MVVVVRLWFALVRSATILLVLFALLLFALLPFYYGFSPAGSDNCLAIRRALSLLNTLALSHFHPLTSWSPGSARRTLSRCCALLRATSIRLSSYLVGWRSLRSTAVIAVAVS